MERGDDSQERLTFIRPASLPGTELLTVHGSRRAWRVFYEQYAFSICLKSASGVRYRGREDEVCDGDITVREPGETHSNTYVAKPGAFRKLFVEPSVVAAAASELGHPDGFHFAPGTIRSDPCLYRALYRLCASIGAKSDQLVQQCLFSAMLVEFARHTECKRDIPEVRNGRRAVGRAIAELRERFDQLVTLDELASISGLSRFRLAHAFTEETGLAPHAYQVCVRVEHARTLLRRGLTPAVVAATVGFADQSHFTRHFRKIMRITPSKYAGMIR